MLKSTSINGSGNNDCQVGNGCADEGNFGNDTHPEDTLKEEEKTYKRDIIWVNVFVLMTMHVLAVYGFYLKFTSPWMISTSLLIKIFIIAETIGMMGGAHRLWCHKSYKANTALQCLLMFMATLTYQGSVYTWVRQHRVHHKCCDTDGDPHNAARGFFFSHVGWVATRQHPELIKELKSIDMSDLKANKIVMFQHKYYYPLVFLGGVVLPVTIARYLGIPWEETIISCFLYRFTVSLNITFGINSFAHLYGCKPYDKNIGPVESPIMRYVALGEGFHNYHHTFPWDYKTAEFSGDVRNMTTGFIDFFAWLGWATDLRFVAPDMIDKRCERTGGPGREYHMMKNHSNKSAQSNITSGFVLFLFLLIV